jgi:hypothetical protein
MTKETYFDKIFIGTIVHRYLFYPSSPLTSIDLSKWRKKIKEFDRDAVETWQIKRYTMLNIVNLPISNSILQLLMNVST